MKRIIFITSIFISFVCLAQDPANTIVNNLQGAGAPCKTPDGRNGRMYPTATTTTTTVTTTSGTNQNSGSNTTTVSSNANASLTNPGISGGVSNTTSSGTTTKNNSTTTTTTTTVTNTCVPNNK